MDHRGNVIKNLLADIFFKTLDSSGRRLWTPLQNSPFDPSQTMEFLKEFQHSGRQVLNSFKDDYILGIDEFLKELIRYVTSSCKQYRVSQGILAFWLKGV